MIKKAKKRETQRTKEIKENRQCTKPIIESIVFVVRHNIALRGHGDDGEIFSHFIFTDPSSKIKSIWKSIKASHCGEFLKFKIKHRSTQSSNIV